MIDLKYYRQMFPHIKQGTVYMNHSAVSPLSNQVVTALQHYLHQRSETEIENYFSFQALIAETRQRIGKILNAPPDRIAFVSNTSSGLNLLASGIPWKPGDRILLNDLEFPANIYPFLNCQRFGVEIDFVKHRQGSIHLEDIENAITPRTRLLSISHVQFLSGYRSNLEQLGNICHQRGMIFCVDPIQSLGATALDTQKFHIDFLSCGGHKWLMAPQGIGFIYLTETLQNQLQQAYAGWTSVQDEWNLLDYRLDFQTSARRYETGTMNFMGICGLHAALGLLLEVGLQNIEPHILSLTTLLIAKLAELGYTPITPTNPTERLGIVSFKHNNSYQIFENLKSHQIEIAEREGFIRFSPHFYNTHEEILTAMAHLATCAK